MNVNNWFVVGRTARRALMNMTGGSLTQQDNGNSSTSGAGNGAQGTLNQSGGTVNVFGQLSCRNPATPPRIGTYNLSGSGC